LVSIFDLSLKETLSTTIFLHLGTGLAALIYYREEVFQILVGKSVYNTELRAKLFLITMITGVVGLPVYMWLDVSITVGEMLLAITGLSLIFSGLIQRQAAKQNHSGSELTWSMSIILGVAQGLAIIPGLSRSGLTTSIMLLRNFTGEEAFRISFLMSIPASFAAAFGLMLVEGFIPDTYAILSAFTAAVIGYLAIDSLLELARRISFWKICVGLGTLAVIAWLPNLVV
jgi:undecaprenyl-diphosphatase